MARVRRQLARQLAGVFTDGDLPAGIASADNVLAQPLAKVMTRNPVAVRETRWRSEALKIFNERNIDDLIGGECPEGTGWTGGLPGLPKWEVGVTAEVTAGVAEDTASARAVGPGEID